MGKFVSSGQTHCPGLTVKTITERFANRQDAATDTLPCFEDCHLMTSPHEFVAGNQPSHSRTNNDNLFRAARSRQKSRLSDGQQILGSHRDKSPVLSTADN